MLCVGYKATGGGFRRCPRELQRQRAGAAARWGARLPTVAALFWACLCVGLPSVQAEGAQTWSDVEYTVARTKRFTLSADGTLRFAETVGDLYDRRLGTTFEYEVAKDVRIGARYLFLTRDAANSSQNENRLVAGISYPILRSGVAIEGGSYYERHIVPASDFNRFQQHFEVSRASKAFSPWLFQQFTFRQGAGFVRSRSRLGLQWRVSRHSIRAAYQFETRKTAGAWAPRHAIYTEVSIDQPLWSRE
ncbi:MAG: DUF2490 domain-containing protein [Bryobacterales bacterium]